MNSIHVLLEDCWGFRNKLRFLGLVMLFILAGNATLQAQCPNPGVTVVGTDITCNGASDGIIGITVDDPNGYTGQYTYSIIGLPVVGPPIFRVFSTTAVTHTFTSLPPANYAFILISIDDNAACATLSGSPLVISEPAALSLSATTLADCDLTGSGSIDLTVTGGNAPMVRYTWTGGLPDQEDHAGTVNAGTYDVEIEDSKGCIATLTGIVVPGPSDATINAAGPFCANDGATTLTAATAGGTWSGTGITNGVLGTFDPAVAGPGIHLITYDLTDGNGCFSSDTENFTVNALPDPTITPAGPFCVDAAAVNLVAATAGGTWSGTGITNAVLGTFDPATAGAGTHTISYSITDINGCTNVDTEDIVVNPLPDATITPAGPFCVDGSPTNLVAATAGGTWSGTGITNGALGTFDPAVAGIGTFTITYNVTDVNGCINSDTEDITVNPLPDATITPAGPFCANDVATTLTAATAGGTWSGTGITNGALGTFDPATAGAGTHTITYTVTDGNGCTNLDTEDIVVNPLPDATITPAGPFCVDAAAVNLVAATAGGAWSGTGITNGVLGTFDPATAGIGTHTITYTVTDGNGCTNFDTEDIVVNPLPDATITPAGPFCLNDAATNLSAATAGGTWSGTGITNGVLGTFDPATAGIGTHTITYTVTDGNGCTNLDTEDIVVNALPDATITPAGPFCVDAAAVNLVAATGGGTWSGTGITNGALGTFDPATAGIGTHTITYTITDGNGCTNFDTEDIVVNPLPDATITPAGPFCLNDAATNLSAATAGGTWSGTGITNGVLGTFDPATAGIGTHTITYTVTDGNGCTNFDTEDIVVNPLPDATITPAGPVCLDAAAFNLTAATPGGAWSGTGITDAVNGTFDPTVAGAGTFTITYNVTDGNGCTNLDTEDITVNPLPDATITPPGPVCVNTVAFNLTAATGGGAWSGTGITDAVNGTFDAAIAGVGTHTITYTVTDGNGCTNFDTEDIVVNPLPDATITLAGPFCVNAAAINLVAATPGGAWSGTGITNGVLGTFDPATAGVGTHTITYTVTDGNGCTNFDTEDIVVNALPDATITPAGPFCVDAAAINLAAATAGGAWSGTGITDGLLGTFDPATAGIGTHTITYTVTDGNGCTNADTEDIVVNPLPDATINAAGPFCLNSAPTNLSAVTPGGNWSGTGITDVVNGTFDAAIAGVGTHTITYDVTDGNGCNNTSTIDIVVNALPDAGTDSIIDVCKSDNVTDLFAALGGTPQAGGIWNDDDGSGGLTGSTFDATVAGVIAGNSYDFTYSTTTPGCAPATATVTVNVIVEPNSGTGSNGTACITTTNFDLYTLLSGYDAGGSWNDDNLTFALSGVDNEIFDASVVAPNNTYAFTYIITSPTCPTAGTTVMVTVVNNLNAGTAVANLQVCTDETAYDLFNGLTGNDAGGTWADDNGTGELTGNLFNASGVVPGFYMFTYTIAAAGCTSDTEQITVEVLGAPASFAGADQRVCINSTALAATAVGAGETGTWIGINGAPTPDNINLETSTVSNLLPGDNLFVWSVTNATCTVTDTVIVTFVDIQPATVGADQTICVDFADLTGNAVNPAYEEGLWTYTGAVIPAPTFSPDPPTTENVTVNGLLPGEVYQFTWTISDQNPLGCASNSATVTITVENTMVLNMAGVDISTCGGNDGEVSVNVLVGGIPGTGTYTYAWTDPNGDPIAINSAILSNLALVGTYNVTVTDTGLGCSVSNSVNITEPVNFTLGIAGNNISTCGGNDGDATLTVTGGSGNFTFAWTGPNGFTAGTQNITNLTDAGNYSVDVTDNISGCTDNINIDITEPVNFTLGIAGNNISTCGGNDGDATLTVTGGSGNFTFAWTGPNGFIAGTQNITNLTDAGNYSVDVTDNISGCTDNINIDITEPVNFTLGITGNNISTCGGNDGDATLTVVGGSGNYTFAWTGPNGFTAATQNIANLTDAGNYSVDVTDNISGCTDNINIDITEPVNFTLGIAGNNISTCGGNDGDATLTVTGGSGDFTFAWTGPNGFTAATQNITNLSDAGNYSVDVTDNASGCTDNINIDITEPVNFTLSATGNNITTCGGNQGAVNLEVTLGSGNYSYNWTGPGAFTATSEDISGLAVAGTYTVTVTDNISGCVDNIGFVLSEPAGCGGTNCGAFTVIVDEIRPSCTNKDDGVLTFTIAGGVPNYTVILTSSNGDQRAEIASGALPIIFDKLTADNFTYEIRDQNGNVCILPYSLQLESVVNAIASNFVDVNCFGENTGEASITITSGGVAPFDYSVDGLVWNTLPPDGIVRNLPALGTYNILVRDDATDDCHEQVEVTINNAFPEIDMTYTTTDATCTVGGGSIEVLTVTGGQEPYSYQLDGTDFTSLPAGNTFTDLSAGFHFLSVIDNTGCTKTFDIMVNAPGLVAFTPTITSSPDCSGNGQNGTISVQVTDIALLPGSFEAAISQDINDPGQFQLMTSGGFIEFRDLNVGAYFITVQSPGGCPNARSITISNGPVALGFDLEVECYNNAQAIFLSNISAEVNTPFDLEVYRVGEINPVEVITLNSLPAGNVYRIEGLNFLNSAGNFQLILSQNQTVCGNTIKSGVSNFNITAPLAATLGEITQSFPERATGTIMINDVRGGAEGYEIMIEPSGGNWIEVPRNQTNQEFEFLFTDLFPGDYEIFIRDSIGCEVMFQVTVPQNIEVFIPNVFTPNGDSYNDTFFIRNLPGDGSKLLITNRLGRKIYQTDNYQNDWDGETNTDGVYFYTIDINGEKHSGWVEIWRGGIGK